VIAVAATNAASDTWASFSNYGSSWVDVSAPGVSVFSSNYLANNVYSQSNGTSFSAPIVSGLAAIIRGRNPAMLPTGVRVRIETNVVDVPSLDVAKGAVRLDRAIDDDRAVKYNDSPESGQLYIGSEAPGTEFTDVRTRDNQYWVIRGTANGASAGFDFEDQNSERLGSLALGLDIKANKSATAEIQFYNYRTGVWDTVSNHQIGTTEQTIWGAAVDNVGYYHILTNRYINARVISRTASVQLSIDWAKMAVRRIP
jgi:subtilisin family serine protease